MTSIELPEGVTAVAAAPGAWRGGASSELLARLPASHRALVADHALLSVFEGHAALLGAPGGGGWFDLPGWNRPDLWKDVWEKDLDGWLCFGMSAFGDQYAYRLDDLERGDASVWSLDAFEMEPEEIHPSFDAFFEDEFLALRDGGGDDWLIRARHELGPLPAGHLLAAMPPPLLGEGEPAEFRPLVAATAMVLNGDVWRQVQGRDGETVVRIDPWEDGRGRARYRVVFG